MDLLKLLVSRWASRFALAPLARHSSSIRSIDRPNDGPKAYLLLVVPPPSPSCFSRRRIDSRTASCSRYSRKLSSLPARARKAMELADSDTDRGWPRATLRRRVWERPAEAWPWVGPHLGEGKERATR